MTLGIKSRGLCDDRNPIKMALESNQEGMHKYNKCMFVLRKWCCLLLRFLNFLLFYMENRGTVFPVFVLHNSIDAI